MASERLWSLLTALVCVCTCVEGDSMWCSPKLWEGHSWTLHIAHTDHGPDIVESMARISVDVLGQRYAREETGQRNGQHFKISYLYYFPANTLYTMRDGQCETRDLHGNITQMCADMPDLNYTFLEYVKEYIGVGQYGVVTHGDRKEEGGVGHFYTSDISGNIPVMEEKHGDTDHVPSYTVTNYFNVTIGIRDPRVFTPPDSCIKP